MIFLEQRMVVAVTSNVTGAEVAPIAMALTRLFDPARDAQPLGVEKPRPW